MNKKKNPQNFKEYERNLYLNKKININKKHLKLKDAKVF
jgi:hypothetical protein